MKTSLLWAVGHHVGPQTELEFFRSLGIFIKLSVSFKCHGHLLLRSLIYTEQSFYGEYLFLSAKTLTTQLF